MKSLLTAALLISSFTAIANGSTPKSVLIVESEIGRGDALYSKISGYESIGDYSDNRSASVLIECKKTMEGSTPTKPSYITIKDSRQDLNLFQEISLTECLDLFNIVNDASANNPVEIVVDNERIIDVIR
jgi:hypothetical protein